MKSIKLSSEIVISVIVIFVAVSLNILLTLKLDESHIGIRVAATDFMIPVLILFFTVGVISNRKIPELIMPLGWKLLILMSLWMFVCLINGYLNTGEMMIWALVNKFLGWFVLMSYFISGVYIGTQDEKLKVLFFRVLLLASWLVCSVEVTAHWLFSHGYLHQYSYISSHHRMEGLYQNPNAFGIFLSVIFIMQMYVINKSVIFNKFIILTGSILVLLCVFYSYSRSAWVGLLLGMVATIFVDKRIARYLIISFALAYVMNFMAFSDYTRKYNDSLYEHIHFDTNELTSKVKNILNTLRPDLKEVNSVDMVKANDHKDKKTKLIHKSEPIQLSVKRLTAIDRIKSDGLSIRLEILKRSVSYWLKSPVVGIGLGAHIWHSQKEGVPSDAITIHNSANWLLVETGLVGVLIFSVFLIICVKSLYLKRPVNNEFLPSHTMISIIFIMMGASLATEVIYQRYFWLLLGIFLVKVKSNLVKSY